jgi:K+-sensing histidine kinase KdpD
VEEELIEEPWLVNADSRYFARVVNNIIANAEKHGFVDSERKDYKLDIRLGLNDDRTMYQIDFANNGKSLPTGFDKRLYGIRGEKAGCTAGAGIGGHIVKSFVENYNGDYDLFMDNNEVVIRILLPIFRKGE